MSSNDGTWLSHPGFDQSQLGIVSEPPSGGTSTQPDTVMRQTIPPRTWTQLTGRSDWVLFDSDESAWVEFGDAGITFGTSGLWGYQSGGHPAEHADKQSTITDIAWETTPFEPKADR